MTRHQKMRTNRIAAGLCAACGKEPPVSGRTLCQNCRDKQCAATKLLRERKKMRGECAFCNSPAVPGQVLCRECADKNHARALRYQAKRKNV